MRLLLLSLALISPVSANPLEKFQWEKRLILSYISGDSKAFQKQFLEHKEALAGRDLIIINLAKSELDLEGVVKLSNEEKRELRSRYQLSHPADSVFILIGKDGGEKSRQLQTWNPEKFFALIDTMPMRKAEMKKQQK